jgi:hypothetical protein
VKKYNNNEKLLRAISEIDGDLIERATPNEERVNNGQQQVTTNSLATSPPPKRASDKKAVSAWVKWAVPLAAGLVVVALLNEQLAKLQSSRRISDAGSGNKSFTGGDALPGGALSSGEDSYTLSDITGLPATDYTWDEGADSMADRLGAQKLAALFYVTAQHPETPFSFSVVKITAVQRTGDQQNATAVVLWDTLGEDIGGSFGIHQTLYGGCLNDEQTNLVREGGAYFLPLAFDGTRWTIWCDLDVLFEIDNENLVHSHSRFTEFQKYDGQPLDILWKDASYIFLHPILASYFADYIVNGYTLDISGSQIALVAPDGHWDEADKDYFSAQIDESGKIYLPTENYSLFSTLIGKTADEVNQEIQLILRFNGLADSTATATHPTPTLP